MINPKKEIYHKILKTKKILFNHLPKCGGTTVGLYLMSNFPDSCIYQTDSENLEESVAFFKKLSDSERRKYKLVLGHAAHELLDYVAPNTFNVTVLREPINRIISHYFYARNSKGHYLYDQIRNNNIQLEDYCSLNISRELRNWYVIHFTGLSIDEAESRPDEAINLAYRIIIENYNLVGFQEGIPEFMNELKKETKLKVPYIDVIKNKTTSRIDLKDLPQNTRDKIAQINFLDVQLYEKLIRKRKNGIIKKE